MTILVKEASPVKEKNMLRTKAYDFHAPEDVSPFLRRGLFLPP
jgi:hypothetical protein